MKLWSHQEQALNKLLASKTYALHMEAGTGKTAVAIKWIESILQKQDHRVLIFAPPIVCDHWVKEFERFSQVSAVSATGSTQKKLKAFESKSKIIVTNYEAVRSKDVLREIYKFAPTVLICDESQRIKSPSAKQSKEIYKISKDCSFKLNMTGTPITNSEMDLFQQFLILDGGQTFGNNFFSFRAKYFEDKNARKRGMHNYFPDWQIRITARDEIARILAKRAFVARKSECLDLPDMVYNTIDVELSIEQKKSYVEMKKDFLTFVKDAQGDIHSSAGRLAITKALRLQQIVSGFISTEEENEVSFSKNPRLDALKELLMDLPLPVIVWASFRQNYKAIEKVCVELGLRYGFLIGGQSENHRRQTLNDFREKKLDVLIANQGAGGVGVNLIEAPNAIYFSRDFSLEKDIQSEARNYRGGSEIHEKITRYDLVAKGTIDEDILFALKNKKNVLEFLLQGEK